MADGHRIVGILDMQADDAPLPMARLATAVARRGDRKSVV
jgi:hypothetical protein